MADIHDEALAWAQSNPSDPRSQDIMAKAWASKNPNDPRATQILTKLGGQSDSGPSMLDSALSKAKSFVEGAGNALTLGNTGNIGGAVQALASYLGKPGQTDRDLEAQGYKIQQPSAFDLGKLATNDELDASYKENPWTYRAGYVSGAAPLAAPGRAVYDAVGGGIKGSAALGAAQGAFTDVDPHNPSTQIGKAAGGALVGTALAVAGKAANKGLDLLKHEFGDWARMTPAQANAYLKDPSGVSQMAQLLDNDAENPQGLVDLQNQAKDAISNSRAVLKAKGLKNAGQLRTILDGKSATINPADYEGLDPEVDDLLQKARAKIAQSQGVTSPATQPELNLPYNEATTPEKTNPFSFQDVEARQPEQPSTADSLKRYFAKLAGLTQDESPAVGGSANTEVTPEAVSNFKDAAGLSSNEVPAVGREAASSSSPDAFNNFKQMVSPEPESLDVDLNDLNNIKRILQQKSEFAPGTVVDPQQAARNSLFASKSHGLRTLIEREGVAPLNQEMQDSMLLQKALRSGAKNSPLAFVSSESPDRMATLARAETQGAGGLFDFGNQLGAAKAISAKNTGSGITSKELRLLGRAGLGGVGMFQPAVKEATDFPWLQQVLQESAQTGNSNDAPTRPSLFSK